MYSIRILEEENETSNESGFLRLDDEAILEVLSRLSVVQTLEIQGIFGKRVDNLALQRIVRGRFLTLKHNNLPEYDEGKWILIGQYIYSLKIFGNPESNIDNNKILDILAPLLKSASESQCLQKLALQHIQFDTCVLRLLSNVAYQLTTLDLSYCHLTEDMFSELLQDCLDLRKLIILGNDQLTGECLNCLYISPTGESNIRMIYVEITKNWTLNLLEFVENYTKVLVKAYNEGSTTFTEYVGKDYDPKMTITVF